MGGTLHPQKVATPSLETFRFVPPTHSDRFNRNAHDPDDRNVQGRTLRKFCKFMNFNHAWRKIWRKQTADHRGETAIATKINQPAKPPLPALSNGEGNQTKQAPGSSFPIVGIGASAGGIAAYEAFFSGMSGEDGSGMAFVLVQHLAPDHESILTNIIQGFTSMQVFEVKDGMEVQPNCVYVIPPNTDMSFAAGALRLQEPAEPRGQRMAIDFFFRSLAEQLHERAIGIVLSGTGSDGTLGVRAIKAQGGMAMAQNPESCGFDGMPRSAIATGLVDYELSPSEMPKHLVGYVSFAFGTLPKSIGKPGPGDEDALKAIFLLLRSQSGHDFSQYKRSTIHRRIGRRMAVHQIETMDAYEKRLQQSPAEVETLFRDLLIGVTSFFRDAKVFSILEEKIIPGLLEGKSPGTTIRVWSAGCSTGEEAYSIAILMQEQINATKQSYTAQVFATDIDSRSIAVARAGTYPASIAADMSQERLTHFFTADSDGSTYRIDKEIRDMVIFSEQDVIKDPPFSKLDLICCRNLMIYFDSELQKKLIPLFHFALRPGGILVLGTSEGIGGFEELFSAVDRESKIYRRKEVLRGTQRLELGRFIGPLPAAVDKHAGSVGKSAVPAELALKEMAESTLLRQAAPPAAMVNAQGDVLYLHGRTGMFLEPAPGVANISNVLKMAREGLQPGLATSLHKAIETKETVTSKGVRVRTNGHFTLVDLAVHPVPSISTDTSPLYLITFAEASAVDGESAESAGGAHADVDARIATLKQELRA